MLAEFALLPSVFDEKAHPDVVAWKEQLRELGHGMFPRNVGCPVVVADFQDGAWREHVAQIVRRVSDPNARRLAQGLLTQIREVAVRRPGHLKRLVNHLDWAHEAMTSHEATPLDRIVACSGAGDESHTLGTEVWDLRDVDRDEFWNQISPDWSPPQDIAQQVEMLGRLCLHGEFLSLISPYVGGSDDDETDFAIALIQRTFARPSGYLVPQIEVHVEGPSVEAGHPEFADRLRRKIENISQRLSEALRPDQQIALFVWPKLLDRYLLAGSLQRDAKGAMRKYPRWGVHLGHIARKIDSRRATTDTDWKLVNRERLLTLFRRYVGDGSTGHLLPSPIWITK